MIRRAGWLAVAMLGLLGAQQLPPKPPPDDDVTAYLRERREPALRAMAVEERFQSGIRSLAAGEYAEAEAAFRDVWEQTPQSPRGPLGVIDVYAAQNRREDALRVLDSAMARRPILPNTLFELSGRACELKEYGMALAALQRFAGENPDRADTYFHLAEVYRAQGDLTPAIAALRKSDRLAPAMPATRLALAKDLAAVGQAGESNALYREVLGADPTDSRALLDRFKQLRADRLMAAACAELALKLAPDDAEARSDMGLVYLSVQGGSAQAVMYFEKAIASAPSVVTYRIQLATALQQIGEWNRTQSELRKALELKPTDDEKQRIEQMLASVDKIMSMGKK